MTQPTPAAPDGERMYTATELREALYFQELAFRATIEAKFGPQAQAPAAPVRHLTVVR